VTLDPLSDYTVDLACYSFLNGIGPLSVHKMGADLELLPCILES
jgi:hypothetical protein